MKNLKLAISMIAVVALLATNFVGLEIGTANASSQFNLLYNPGGETGNFMGWTTSYLLDDCVTGPDGITGLCMSGTAHGGSYGFATSYPFADQWATMSQEIDLSEVGYSDDLMDTAPDIATGVWATAVDE